MFENAAVSSVPGRGNWNIKMKMASLRNSKKTNVAKEDGTKA